MRVLYKNSVVFDPFQFSWKPYDMGEKQGTKCVLYFYLQQLLEIHFTLIIRRDNNMYTQSPSYTTLYFVIRFFLGQPVSVYKTIFSPLFLLKAHMTSSKMYALQLKIIRSQRYNIACDTITYYGNPFTLEKCFFTLIFKKHFSNVNGFP